MYKIIRLFNICRTSSYFWRTIVCPYAYCLTPDLTAMQASISSYTLLFTLKLFIGILLFTSHSSHCYLDAPTFVHIYKCWFSPAVAEEECELWCMHCRQKQRHITQTWPFEASNRLHMRPCTPQLLKESIVWLTWILLQEHIFIKL